MVKRAAGAGGGAASERLALPTVELMSLEAQLGEQLRIGSGDTGGGGGGGGDEQQRRQLGRPLVVLEFVLDGMPLPAFQRLVGMMSRFGSV